MEVITTLTAAQLTVLTLAVIGATELIARLRAKDFWTSLTIVSAGVIGALIALYYAADPLGGVVLGMGASGAVKAISAARGKSVLEPSSPVDPDYSAVEDNEDQDDASGVDEDV